MADAMDLARKTLLDCMEVQRELDLWMTYRNKAAGRRARVLLDDIANEKAALRRAMVQADREMTKRWKDRKEGDDENKMAQSKNL